MKFRLYKKGYLCQTCNSTFSLYGFLDFGYGQFILYNRINRMIYWSVPEDKTAFNEVRELMTPILSTVTIKLPKGAIPIQWIMGISCDRIGDSSVFRKNPYCPVCGSYRTEFAGPITPLESKEFDVPIATHHTWEKLSENQKRELVVEALNELQDMD